MCATEFAAALAELQQHTYAMLDDFVKFGTEATAHKAEVLIVEIRRLFPRATAHEDLNQLNRLLEVVWMFTRREHPSPHFGSAADFQAKGIEKR